MRFSISPETKFAFVLLVIAEILNLVFDLYNLYVGYDVITHFIGGVLVATIMADFVKAYINDHAHALNVLVTVGIGALWELAEFATDMLTGWSLQFGLRDTMGDLLVVFCAALVVNAIYILKKN
ncbi:MAG: hypothetical protein NUV67_01345 [archaeon]|nr:hypothetical protein [archaeon]